MRVFSAFVVLFVTLAGCGGSGASSGPDLVHIPALPSAPRPLPLAHADPSSPAPTAKESGRAHGSPLQVEWHGKYYPATVIGPAEGGKVRIHYNGYGSEWDEDVGEDRIREASYIDPAQINPED